MSEDTQIVPTSPEVRQTVILEIIRLVQSGKKLKESLEELGIPEATYYRWKRENAGIITQFLAKQQETLSIQLADLAITRQSAIQQLMDKVNGGALTTGELLAVETRLGQLYDSTAHVLGTEDKQQEGAAKFLTGIKTKPGVSKVTRTTVTEEIHFDDPPPEVINANIIEEAPEQ